MSYYGATSSLRELNRSANQILLPIFVMVLISGITIGLPAVIAEQSSYVPWLILLAVALLAVQTYLDGDLSVFHAKQYLLVRGRADQSQAESARTNAAWWEWWLQRSLIMMGVAMVICCGYGHLYAERTMSSWTLLGVCVIGLYAYGLSAWICWDRFHRHLGSILNSP